ncbi:MAG: hypothetical protein PHU24_05460 [Sphaerochaetaceae bacterium]|nr:hypothetical protein [Sphaerochaetaceae bacterium]MDD2405884.1 hypothetical protein [Sphaerochaetaceae bacterium]MDD4258252.1 hypothetical protein [Sphaerochaetaceae bacterium]MDD4764074.1 hypothetical protein [Sphaerochaetaceae bacterium]MDD4841924.1 hypothetical protein [Sphaerochaetaceae bacterium]
MKVRALFVLLLLVCAMALPLSARTVYLETIEVTGQIGLQENFRVDLRQADPIVLDKSFAGQDMEIATYEFYSNNSDTVYNLKITPATLGGSRSEKFMFTYVGGSETDLKKKESMIPFTIKLMSIGDENPILGVPNDKEISKNIGMLDGSNYRETGSIIITFPTEASGFKFEELASGYYRAALTIEVSAD